MKKTIFLIFCGLFLFLNFVSAIYYAQDNFDSNGNYLGSEIINDPLSNFPTGKIIIINPSEKTRSEKLFEAQQKLSDELAKKAKDSVQQSYKSNSLCYFPIATGCTTVNDLGRITALCSNSGTLDSPMCGVNACKQQIADYNRQTEEYNKCIASPPPQQPPYIPNSVQPSDKLDWFDLNNICEENYGIRSYYNENTKSCACEKLSWMFAGKCQLGLLICVNLLGPNVIASTTEEVECSCIDGYNIKEISDNKFSCEKIEPTPISSPLPIPVPTITPIPISQTKPRLTQEKEEIKPIPTQIIQPTIQPSATSEINNQIITQEHSSKPIRKSWVINLLANISNFFKRLFSF